ncbi:MAG: glycosyltransferase [Candidatus Hodarchaeales archaeon]|jgi:glycosyltransferase involved in cell wall biosynthesis
MIKNRSIRSDSPKSVILALNAESVFAIRWIIGYLRTNSTVLVISPYDLRKNFAFNILREEFSESESIQLFQISSRSGYLSQILIIRYIKAFVYLYSAKRKNKNIVFHTHNLGHFALLGLILNPKKHVVSPYGSDFFSISWIRRFVLRLLLRRADLIIPHSDEMVTQLIKDYSVSKNKIFRIHTGVDLKKWKKPSNSTLTAYRKRLDIPEGSVVFLSYRNCQSIYQIHLLPSIHFRLLQQNIPAFFIYVTGTHEKTDYISQIKDLIEHKNLSKHTKLFQTVLKAEKLAKLLFISDYFFSIPKWDNFGVTVQEGMYCECVPILSDLQSYKDVINPETAVIASTKSIDGMTIEIKRAVQLNIHLNERIKNINKNIIVNHYNMEENLKKMTSRIFSID